MTICMVIGALGAAVCLVFHTVFGLDQTLQTSVESNADMVTFGLKMACETMFVLAGCGRKQKAAWMSFVVPTGSSGDSDIFLGSA
jgi:hypothetical protein